MDDTAQSSQDRWKNCTNKGEGKEVSREIHEWASTIEDKSHTWNEKLYRQCQTRDILKLAEMAANDEKEADEERHNINELYKQLRKEIKEEDEARALLEEMQNHLEEAQARASATELQVSGRYDKHMRTWDEDRGRPHFIMDKIWQMLQSNDTKTLHLTKDFEELLDMAQQARWLGPPKTGEYWTKVKTQLLGVQATEMDGIMTFAAEWCTTDEVLILRCVSASLFVVVNE